MLTTILFGTFLSSFVSLVGALLLSRKSNWSQPFALHLTALSSGVLLTAALLHLAPEALHESHSGAESVFLAIFAGTVVFFLIERLVLWYHHHHDAHHTVKPSALLITIGDTIHNFIDGVAIASAVMLDPTLGILTIIAIGAHEIPQEIADFAVMVNNGMSKKKALLLNVFSALAAFAGALLTFALQHPLEPYIPYLVAFSAGMFLYIALSDLIPELHHKTVKQNEKWIQLLWFFGGIVLLFVVTKGLEGRIHFDEHEGEVHEEERSEVEGGSGGTRTHDILLKRQTL